MYTLAVSKVSNKQLNINTRVNTSGTIIIALHLAAVLGLPFYFTIARPSVALIVWSSILLVLTTFAIAAGYHRLYSHKAYKLRGVIEFIFLFLSTMAIQGSVIKWCSDHRLHHANIDTEKDPYNVKQGFWHAHVFWLFTNPAGIQEAVVPDLLQHKLLRFQHRYFLALALGCNILVCTVLGVLVGDMMGAFVLGWGVRIVLSYHITWFINSIAHYWGEQSYSKELSARDNAIVAVLTVSGEGYHNYHHTFPSDYRNGIRGYHFDPVKWTVWSLSKVGLAHSLRSFREEHIIGRLLGLDKALLLKKLSVIERDPDSFKQLLGRRAAHTRAMIEYQVQSLADSLSAKHAEIRQVLKERKELRQNTSRQRHLKIQLKELRHSYAQQWKDWAELCSTILKASHSRS